MKIIIGAILLTFCLGFLSCTNDNINDLFYSGEIKKFERIDVKKRGDYYSITFLDSAGATINVENFDKNNPSKLKIKEKSIENMEKYFSNYFDLSNEKNKSKLLKKIFDIIQIFEKYDLVEVKNHRGKSLIKIYDNKNDIYLYSKEGRNVIENYLNENVNVFPKGVFIRDNIYHIILK